MCFSATEKLSVGSTVLNGYGFSFKMFYSFVRGTVQCLPAFVIFSDFQTRNFRRDFRHRDSLQSLNTEERRIGG